VSKHRVTIKISDWVFVLEDNEERRDWFREKIPWAAVALTVCEAREKLLGFENRYDFFFLDHDLGGRVYLEPGDETGYAVARMLASAGVPGCRVLIHSWNPAGTMAMKSLLPSSVCVPFGQFEITVLDGS
jgi:hypothetical protein